MRGRRVDRRQFADVLIGVNESIGSARELTGPSDLKPEARAREVKLLVQSGDVEVVEVITEKK
jgi:hypothetical protein